MTKQCLPLLIVLLIGLGGCAEVIPAFDIPHTQETGAPTIASIRSRIYCELEEIATGTALEQNVSNIEDVDVSVQLSLSVVDDGTLAPTFTYIDKQFSFGTGFRLEKSRQQDFTEWLFFNMRQVKNATQTSRDWRADCQLPADTNLAGRIGLRESFDLAMTGNPNLNWKQTGATGVFGGAVTFIVKKDLTATGPTWTLTHFRGPGSFASASDDNTDKLLFAFTKGSSKDKKKMETAKATGLQFIFNLINTQLSVSLTSINQNFR